VKWIVQVVMMAQQKIEEAGYSNNDAEVGKTTETDCSCNNDGL
jgi:hypothetical protein